MLECLHDHHCHYSNFGSCPKSHRRHGVVLFWHQAEGAVAIIMVSFTAFRSLLGINALNAREKMKRERYWFSHCPKLPTRYFKKTTQDEFKSEQLPSIPGATLTGMRSDNGSDKSEQDRPRAARHKPKEFELEHFEWSQECKRYQSWFEDR